MSELTAGERLAVVEDSVKKLEARFETDGDRVWGAIDKLRSCITNSNSELREHLDKKFGGLYRLIIKGGGTIALLMIGAIGFMFVKLMGW